MKLSALVAGLVLLAVGCGGDDGGGEGTAVGTITVTTPSPPTTAAPSTVAAPTTAAEPTAPTTAAPSTTSAPTTGAVTSGDACRTEHLQISLGTTEGAMGNQYTPIVFTNAGTVPCTLTGFPSVAFVDTFGSAVGAAAVQTGDAGQTVTLAVGEQAHATMDYHDPGVFGDCAPAPTAALEITPPGADAAVTIPFPSSLCTVATPEPEVTIEAVAPGATP